MDFFGYTGQMNFFGRTGDNPHLFFKILCKIFTFFYFLSPAAFMLLRLQAN
jgi:hypothetical protein